MTRLADEKFFAWLDGELDPSESAEVEAMVAGDPDLAARAAEHRAMASKLRSAFAPVTRAAVPEHVAAPLRTAPPSPSGLSAWRSRRPQGVPRWAAMAATLALGMFIGALAVGSGGDAPVESRQGALYAAGDLESDLDYRLASAARSDGGTRIGLTFRDQSGTVCRSFSTGDSTGLACREADKWRVQALVAAPHGQDGDYRMASGADPMLAELISSRIAGEPFDAAQESAARKRGWR